MGLNQSIENMTTLTTNRLIIPKDELEYFMLPGLIIGNTNIQRLSGPIGFTFLRPRNDIKSLPLIVLFGDEHESYERNCMNCDCNRNKNGCCYTITDPNFLRILDTLADDNHPVDFYVETPFTGRGELGGNGYMTDIAAGDMRICYNRLLRDKDIYQKCPTKKIENEYDDSVKKLIDKLEDLYKNKTYDDEELNKVMCDLFHEERAIRTDGLIRSNKCSMVLFDLCPDTIVYNNQNNKTSTLEHFILHSKFDKSSSDHYEDYYADNVFIHLGGFY